MSNPDNVSIAFLCFMIALGILIAAVVILN